MKPAIPPLPDDASRWGIEWLEISVRLAFTLRRNGIVDAEQVYRLGQDILKFRGIGPAALDELIPVIRRQYHDNTWPERLVGRIALS